jgi:hypothetical protein
MPNNVALENNAWFLEETKTANLGDDRLNKRLSSILGALGQKPAESIPVASSGWSETKAAYRFLDNESVTFEKVLEPHENATRERIKKESVVLLPQDTTELDYSGKKQTQGLGKLSYENQLGMHLHATLAVTPERLCLGIVHAEILTREKLKEGKRERLPIEKKESMRWLNSFRIAQKIAEECPDTRVISMSDREGDIYEIFVEAQGIKKDAGGKADWIIRANQNRKLVEVDDEDKNKYKKLFQKIDEALVIGVVEFDLPKLKNRDARKVEQEIRALTVTLKAPYRKDQTFSDIAINVVFAKEINTPVGADPIEWIILTSLPIDSKEKALQVIEYYLCRWQIELFFKVLKVGCAVEELQLKTIDRLKPCLALYMIVAWRILNITMLGRSCPDMPCSSVFEDEEWKAVYIVKLRKQPPTTPPSLDTMIRMIAGLGGFLNRKSDGFPGSQSIWIGLQRSKDFAIAMKVQKEMEKND